MARDLVRQDDVVDNLNKEIFRIALEIGDDHDRREWAMTMILVARAIERIGDNTVDIGEQVAFVVTGLFREFQDASHPGNRFRARRRARPPPPNCVRSVPDVGTQVRQFGVGRRRTPTLVRKRTKFQRNLWRSRGVCREQLLILLPVAGALPASDDLEITYAESRSPERLRGIRERGNRIVWG